MKIINNLFFLLAILFFFSCQKKQIKYEEDPKQTRLTPADRLIGGWLLDEYTFNGSSVLDSLKSKINVSLGIGIELEYFEKNAKRKPPEPERKEFPQFKGTRVAISDEEFSISVTDSVSNYFFTQPFHYKPIKNAVWKVTKLYQNDFNIILFTDTGTYKMFFKKLPG